MFGYLKLDNHCPQHLKVSYKKYYCFLCRALQEFYGFKARFLLSYDVAFFLILCSDDAFLYDFEKIGCIKKSNMLYETLQQPIAKKIAALNVQLAVAKLQDDVIDDDDIKAKAAKLIFSSASNKAKHDFPLMWEIIDGEYKELRRMELDNCGLDDIELQFSKMMKRVAQECFGILDENRLTLLEIGTKWIYFIDAVDDIDDNIAERTFNPLTKFGSLDKLKNENYLYIAQHFNEIRKDPPYLSGGVEADIINRLVDVRLIECTIGVLTRER